MYPQHWGMKQRPFALTHEPAMFVPVESAMLALTKLRYAISAGLGACALIGDAGMGKTELARLAINDFAASGWATVYLPTPAGDRNEMFGFLLHALDGQMGDALSPWEALNDRLTEIAAAGGKVLAVFDDIQCLRDISLLDDLRMLLNIECDGRPVLNMVLCGQPEMRGKLQSASRFYSQIAMEINLQPFDLPETETYMLQRLKNSGCTRGIFTKNAATAVGKASGGNPGNINRLCELALVMAFATKQDKIKPELITAAAHDLHLPEDEYRSRLYDELWSGDATAPATAPEPEEDILAGV